MKQDLSKEQSLSQSLLNYRASLPKIDWESWAKSEFSNSTSTQVLCKDGTYDYELNSPNARIDNSKTCINKGGRAETFHKVVCNDGSTQMVGSNPDGGRVDMPCKNNGGVSKNQSVVNETVKFGVIKQDAEDKFYEKLGIQTQSGGFMSGKGLDSKIKGRALILVVLVGGYFAYKKFKK